MTIEPSDTMVEARRRPGGATWVVRAGGRSVVGHATLRLGPEATIRVDALQPARLVELTADPTTTLGRALLDTWLGPDLAERLATTAAPAARFPLPSGGPGPAAELLGRAAIAARLAAVDTPRRQGLWAAERLLALDDARRIDRRLSLEPEVVVALAERAAASLGDLRLRSLGSATIELLRATAERLEAIDDLPSSLVERFRRDADQLTIGSETVDDLFGGPATPEPLVGDRVMLGSRTRGGLREPAPLERPMQAYPVWLDLAGLVGVGPDATMHVERSPRTTIVNVTLTEVIEVHDQVMLRVLGSSQAGAVTEVRDVVGLHHDEGASTLSATVDLTPAFVADDEEILFELVPVTGGARTYTVMSHPRSRYELLGEVVVSELARAQLAALDPYQPQRVLDTAVDRAAAAARLRSDDGAALASAVYRAVPSIKEWAARIGFVRAVGVPPL